MAESPHPAAPTIRDFADLRRHFEKGEKPAAEHRLGLEHEKIPVGEHGAAPPYDVDPASASSSGSATIRALLDGLADGGHGWQRVTEKGRTIALRRAGATGPASVTIEPGGQFELSDSPRASAREAGEALRAHLAELAGPARAAGLRLLGAGFRPFGTIDDVPWMPKGRYGVMRPYFASLGPRARLAHEMMKRTATVQVNVDYESEADCAEKMRVAMGTSSLVTALWAASPLVDGRATDYQSYRAACWLETDDDRCGLLPFVFDERAADRFYDAYVEWALDVPMFFVHRGGDYLPAHGLPFRRFLDEGWSGERATLDDWELHLSTLFPEVRLKQYLEMRGADAGPLSMSAALVALYRGLLYDGEARAAAWALVSAWRFDERLALRAAVPRLGMRAEVRGEAILGRCRELVAIARAGLLRLGAADDAALLEPALLIAARGRTAADELRAIHAREGGDPDRIAAALALPLDDPA